MVILKKKYIVLVTVLYVLTITILSLIKVSAPEIASDIIGFDKLVHFCFYFGLNTLLFLGVLASDKGVDLRRSIATTVGVILYGVALEFTQQYVGRDFDVYDIVANSIGAITSGVVILCPRVVSWIKHYM